MIKILLIEDDIELAKLLHRMLLLENIEAVMAFHPVEGLALLKDNIFDALVLDLSLPEIDGFEICKMVRTSFPNLPIIISSARSDTLDKVKGFELGADDYLPKPYEPIELAFRIRAILRRGIHVQPTTVEVFNIDPEQHIIRRNNREIQLTKAEYDIFVFLFEKEGFVISREDLLLNIDSIKFQSGLKSIDVIIGRIRQKIGDDTKNPHFIVSIRGVGYKFINA